MKYTIPFLVFAILLAACETTNVYPTKVVEVQQTSSAPVVETKVVEVKTKIDCALIDPSFVPQGDNNCVSICVACLNGGGQCLDTNKNGYGDTCVTSLPSSETPVDAPPQATPAESPAVPFCMDYDNDGYVNCDGSCLVPSNQLCGDCSNFDPTVHPGAEEICDNVDQNCDGNTDLDLMTVYREDKDSDGFGDAFSKITLACKTPAGFASGQLDCNDADASVHPGADEVCSDNIDNNCNQQVDELPCVTYEELCGDSIDNNKNGKTDEDCDCSYVNTGKSASNLLYANWCNKCTAECKLLPDIDVTKDSYKLVLVWGDKADANWPYMNTFKYKQETEPGLSGIGYTTTQTWDSWSGVDFYKGTFVAIDLDPAVKYIRFNEMQYPGTWEICNAAKVTDTFVDFNALNLPMIYVVKNGVWENVTSKVGMQVALDVVSGGKTPKSGSPSGYPVPNYCSAYITF
ncbi:MAG: putative metal-binding motif-containing protein [Candidatus Uhrbacteria bacterium]|nr:putative metal-binding motif-containing protein [Candidatus Uhrbacteria bacterium]